ncbi:unnamed protein product [Linum trigynum]|uniref:Myb-like domain-containing protein n=1 Tax=Linum trigynum TaxID=586398 RepID=A0AAV2D1F7_9ROSI
MAASSAAPPPPQLGAAEEAAAAAGRENGNSNSGEIDERSSNRGEEGDGGGGGGSGGGSYGGNRWPRPETIALLRIRSEMDSVFRDSTPKAPLWEQVSRKLAELGYHRSAKKCKEKFENVYKYHKRTKDGRTAKHDGKTYRFFEELEAFEGKQQLQSPAPATVAAPPPPLPPKPAPALITPALPNHNTIPHQIMPTVPSAHGNSTTTPLTSFNFTITPPSNLSPTAVTPAEPISSSQPLNPSPQSVFHPSYHHHHRQHHNNQAATATAHLFSSSTSSSTASDEDPAAAAGTTTTTRKRKRKWNDFFEKLTRDVIRKQEELQRKFLETVEKLDRERLTREDAWRVQELARINREHEVLVQERSTAAAKDAALLAFLQKMSGQQIPHLSLPPPPPLAAAPITAHATPQPAPTAQQQAMAPVVAVRRESSTNGAAASASRWPKVEINALIALRTRLDEKYQENGPKGPLWEEISTEMRKIGYNRSAKRCKEKWENINKYFKKVKESNKRRPENSKTCPYFEQLDALYREKSISTTTTTAKIGTVIMSSSPPPTDGCIAANPLRAVEPAAGMAQTQQQWQAHPVMSQQLNAHHDEEQEEGEEDDEEEEEDYEDLETEDDEEGVGVRGGDNGGGFQVVQNRPIAANEQ